MLSTEDRLLRPILNVLTKSIVKPKMVPKKLHQLVGWLRVVHHQQEQSWLKNHLAYKNENLHSWYKTTQSEFLEKLLI